MVVVRVWFIRVWGIERGVPVYEVRTEYDKLIDELMLKRGELISRIREMYGYEFFVDTEKCVAVAFRDGEPVEYAVDEKVCEEIRRIDERIAELKRLRDELLSRLDIVGVDV